MTNGWRDPEHVSRYLERADRLPHRHEGEQVLLRDLAGCLPGRVLDLGCGDGRLAALVLATYPGSTAVGIDMSPTMLDAVRARFARDERVEIVAADLAEPLPVAGSFDAIVSSFAIHHVEDERKQTLYAEAASLLAPSGVFTNLDLVASPTPALHAQWRSEMDAVDDPADRLCELPPQLEWLRAAGLDDVDCIWKWRSLALLRGQRPATRARLVR
jgi:tRNA (cmo5U34)-methyltransferase